MRPGDHGLVTGEAVAVELQGAGLGVRVLSGLIDVVVTVVAMIVVVYLLAQGLDGVDEAVSAGIGIVVVVGLLVVAPAALEHATGGRTLGKMALGLRTVRDDGGPADLRRYLTRHLVGVIEVWALGGSPALLAGLFTARTKRLGDLAAGTTVVRDRKAPPPPRDIETPPALAGWAAQAQVSAVPDDVLRAARHLLRHGAQLNPQVAHRIASDLAARAVTHVAPPPPPAPPRDLLRAVLARRRDLDAARLARADRLRARLFPG